MNCNLSSHHTTQQVQKGSFFGMFLVITWLIVFERVSDMNLRLKTDLKRVSWILPPDELCKLLRDIERLPFGWNFR